MDFQHLLSLFIFFLLSFPKFSNSSVLARFLNEKNMDNSYIRLKKSDLWTGFDPTRVIQLSWQPRAFLHKNFLSDEECDHLINLAKDKLEVSMVADNDSGKSVKSEVRTSSGMFLDKKQDEVVETIEARIAAWTFLPHENGEAMQILHYENGQKYEPHYDYFHDKKNQKLGGHRVAIVLMYLSDVGKGGETVFPDFEGKETQPKDDTWFECAHKGYADVLVKKRSETIKQAAPISIDEVAGSTGCHPQSPPPVVTTVESTGDCGMDVGPVKKKPAMDKQREIQAIKAGLPIKTCLRRRPRHSSLDVTPELLQPDYNVTVEYRKYQRKYPQKKKTSKETNALPTRLGATLPLVSDTVAVLGSREPVLVQQEEAVRVQQDVKEQAPVRVTRSKRQLL